MNKNRTRLIKKGKVSNGPVIYFMSRDQRLHDNWALIFAAEHAARYKKPLVITFCVAPSFMGAGIRHYDFMLKNIKQLISLSNKNNIPFILLQGDPSVKIPWLLKNTSALITILLAERLSPNLENQRDLISPLS